jgi:hypothetical protein
MNGRNDRIRAFKGNHVITVLHDDLFAACGEMRFLDLQNANPDVALRIRQERVVGIGLS